MARRCQRIAKRYAPCGAAGSKLPTGGEGHERGWRNGTPLSSSLHRGSLGADAGFPAQAAPASDPLTVIVGEVTAATGPAGEVPSVTRMKPFVPAGTACRTIPFMRRYGLALAGDMPAARIGVAVRGVRTGMGR